jgi:hypothetical protein
MSITPQIYAKARSEIIALFRWDADILSPDQMLRLDCAVALRLALDDLQGRVIRGESIDMGRMLTASEALARLLPPAVLATPPAEPREDPRKALLEMILQMRERDADGFEGYDGKVKQVEVLQAEIAQLRAQLAGKTPEDSDVPTVVERVPAPAPAAKVVPLPRAAAPGPAAKASPSYDYDRERGWRDHVQPDGSISPTPFGGGRKWWGPVNAAR